jgi:hypothetical protein
MLVSILVVVLAEDAATARASGGVAEYGAISAAGDEHTMPLGCLRLMSPPLLLSARKQPPSTTPEPTTRVPTVVSANSDGCQ